MNTKGRAPLVHQGGEEESCQARSSTAVCAGRRSGSLPVLSEQGWGGPETGVGAPVGTKTPSRSAQHGAKARHRRPCTNPHHALAIARHCEAMRRAHDRPRLRKARSTPAAHNPPPANQSPARMQGALAKVKTSDSQRNRAANPLYSRPKGPHLKIPLAIRTLRP